MLIALAIRSGLRPTLSDSAPQNGTAITMAIRPIVARPQRLGGREPGKALGEARHPGEQRVIGDGPEDGEAEGERPERKPGDNRLIDGSLAAGFVSRRLADVPAQIGADEEQEYAEQERHAPAPVEHRRLAQRRGHDGGNGRAEQRAAGGRDLLETAEQAATVLRRPFDHEGGRGTPFAAGREPLHDAKRNQQDRRPDADRLIGRQQADGRPCRTPSGRW